MIHPSEELQQLIQHMQRVIVGKRRALELLVTALLSEGHVLTAPFGTVWG